MYGRRSPVLHGTTTGRSPAACVAALAAVRLVRELRVHEKARAAEQLIRAALTKTFSQAGWAAEVRVAGLLASVAPPRADALRVKRDAERQGVLVSTIEDPPERAWLQVRPPLLVELCELQAGLGRLAAAAGASPAPGSNGATAPARWPVPQEPRRPPPGASGVLTAYLRLRRGAQRAGPGRGVARVA